MTSPSGRRAALVALTRRGLSQRKACRYLCLSRRVAGYPLRQPAADQTLGEQLLAASPQRYPAGTQISFITVSARRADRTLARITPGASGPPRAPRNSAWSFAIG